MYIILELLFKIFMYARTAKNSKRHFQKKFPCIDRESNPGEHSATEPSMLTQVTTLYLKGPRFEEKKLFHTRLLSKKMLYHYFKYYKFLKATTT